MNDEDEQLTPPVRGTKLPPARLVGRARCNECRTFKPANTAFDRRNDGTCHLICDDCLASAIAKVSWLGAPLEAALSVRLLERAVEAPRLDATPAERLHYTDAQRALVEARRRRDDLLDTALAPTTAALEARAAAVGTSRAHYNPLRGYAQMGPDEHTRPESNAELLVRVERLESIHRSPAPVTPTPLALEVRDAIVNGVRCLLCGEPKDPGVDYCEKHRDEETAEIAAHRQLARAERALLDYLFPTEAHAQRDSEWARLVAAVHEAREKAGMK